MKKVFLCAVSLSLVFLNAGCQNTKNRVVEGSVIGGLLGAAAGGIIGHQSGHGGEGAAIGAVAGVLTGAAVGSKIEKPVQPQQQTAEIQNAVAQPSAQQTQPVAAVK